MLIFSTSLRFCGSLHEKCPFFISLLLPICYLQESKGDTDVSCYPNISETACPKVLRKKYCQFTSANNFLIEKDYISPYTVIAKFIKDKDVHLGNNMGSGVESNREMISDFYGRVNITVARFFSKVKPNIKYELLKSYSMSLYVCFTL